MNGEQKLEAIIWISVTLMLASCGWAGALSDHPQVKITTACHDEGKP
jgi:hypothetical protein